MKPVLNTLKNILCVRPDNMGDVLLTQLAFRALKDTFAGSNITLLTSKSGAIVVPYILEIDKTLEFDLPWTYINENNRSSYKILKLVELIQKNKYDAGFIFSNFSQSALPSATLLYLANVPIRVGYSKENPYKLLTHWLPDNEPFKGVNPGVMRQLNLTESIGATTKNLDLNLKINQKDANTLRKKLLKKGINSKLPYIVLHPGASEEKRRYPKEMFRIAARLLVKKLGIPVLVTGTEDETSLASFIVKGINKKIVSVCNELSLGELIALINHARVLVSNNTGPVHIASALKTPVVVLYATTNPEHTPWRVLNRVLYFDVSPQNQSKNTLIKLTTPYFTGRKVSPSHVVDAVIQILEEKNE
jgi:lipopolysaccharide heptosyltransferase II